VKLSWKDFIGHGVRNHDIAVPETFPYVILWIADRNFASKDQIAGFGFRQAFRGVDHGRSSTGLHCFMSHTATASQDKKKVQNMTRLCEG
jgi:hypothetical protein